MGGTISLDDEYNSGVPGSPGTRFVVDLCAGSSSPSSWEVEEGNHHIPKAFPLSRISSHDSEDQIDSAPTDLPECLSVLFVDDDAVLRKLFTRAVQRIRPQWKVRQAANGETALRLVEAESFDVIFMDMYMASVEKQLLGTETVVALRQNGIKSRICGLSANDKEQEFFDAGAEAFMFKPFPCDEVSLTHALQSVLHQEQNV
jgi:CheY-like chemotaxis protein